MKLLDTSLAAIVLGLGLAVASAPASPALGAAGFQDYNANWGDLHALIDRTQTDLRTASDLEHGQKERERYHNAQTALSSFDRGLSKGHFDKGKLDAAIGHLQSVLDHNTIQASSRDALLQDVGDLRATRARHDH